MKKTILSVSFLIGICIFITGQISRNITTNLSELRIENFGEYDKVLIGNRFYTTDINLHSQTFQLDEWIFKVKFY